MRNHLRSLSALESLEARILMAGDTAVISEFMASNQSTIRDPFGDSSDWIEIWNPTNAKVDLSGWHLTDDLNEPTRWTFPSGVELAPQGRLLVWASGRDVVDGDLGLHANFRLNAGGEVVALTNHRGDVVSSYGSADQEYPPQETDVSYGMYRERDDLVDGASSVSFRVPTLADQSTGLGWTEVAFDDSTWQTRVDDQPVAAAWGYEQNPNDDVNYTAEIRTSLPDGTTTFYGRVEFNLASPTLWEDLSLRVKFDDGFAAFLNGELVASANAPSSLSWNSQAEASHADAQSLAFTEFSLNGSLPLLRSGENVLALQGLNRPASSDMLLVAELTATRSATVDEARYLVEPTPGAANGAGVLGLVADTKFSVGRGFFEQPIRVEASSATPGATLVYTLDGSRPTPSHGVQVAAVSDNAAPAVTIPVGTTTTLRAMAYLADWEPTNVDTQTYIFPRDVIRQTGAGLPDTWGHAGADYEMDPRIVDDPLYRDRIIDGLLSLPSVSLVTELDNWFGTRGGVGIYPNGQSSPRPVSVELLAGDGVAGFQVDGSVEIQGGSSTNRWKSDKLSMQLKFKRESGDAKLEYPLFGPDATDQFDTLILDARLNQAWHYGGGVDPVNQRLRAQYTRDQYVADLQNLMGGAAPHGQWVHVYLNGIYWGLHNLHERPDEHFAAAYFGGNDEDYDVIKHNSVVVNGSFANYQRLLTAVERDLRSDANYAAVTQLLDVEQFIPYMLVNYYVGNTDWAHHNWYATYNRVDPDGRWRFHSWDAEHSLENLHDDATGRDDARGPTHIHLRLMLNEDYATQFVDAVQQHFFNDGLLTPAGAAEVYQRRLDQVDAAIVPESARWGDNQRSRPYTRDVEWAAERDRLLNEYFPSRTQTVLGQLRNRGFFPNFDAPGDFDQDGRLAGADVDRLFAAVRAPAPSREFDLNQDGAVDDADVLHWIERLAGTRRGDFNLDGAVDFTDFLTLAGSFGGRGLGWTDGDASGDGAVTFEDFLLVVGNFGFSNAG